MKWISASEVVVVIGSLAFSISGAAVAMALGHPAYLGVFVAMPLSVLWGVWCANNLSE